MIQLTDTEFLTLVFFAAIAFFFLYSQKSKLTKDGLLTDSAVDRQTVISIVEEFTPERSPKLKFGYTEKSIQNQLKIFLRKKILHVTEEYGIEGLNASKIDFNLGGGAVGLELKLASAVFKRAGQDRLVGQVRNYIRSKYNNGNLLVIIFCTDDEIGDNAWKKSTLDVLEDLDAEVVFKELPSAST